MRRYKLVGIATGNVLDPFLTLLWLCQPNSLLWCKHTKSFWSFIGKGVRSGVELGQRVRRGRKELLGSSPPEASETGCSLCES